MRPLLTRSDIRQDSRNAPNDCVFLVREFHMWFEFQSVITYVCISTYVSVSKFLEASELPSAPRLLHWLSSPNNNQNLRYVKQMECNIICQVVLISHQHTRGTALQRTTKAVREYCAFAMPAVCQQVGQRLFLVTVWRHISNWSGIHT